MAIWYLIFWSSYIPMFEGGQYQSKFACEAAAIAQRVHYTQEGYGKLRHKCELRIQL